MAGNNSEFASVLDCFELCNEQKGSCAFNEKVKCEFATGPETETSRYRVRGRKGSISLDEDLPISL